jgi:hypothetical protein
MIGCFLFLFIIDPLRSIHAVCCVSLVGLRKGRRTSIHSRSFELLATTRPSTYYIHAFQLLLPLLPLLHRDCELILYLSLFFTVIIIQKQERRPKYRLLIGSSSVELDICRMFTLNIFLGTYYFLVAWNTSVSHSEQ